MGKYAGKNVLVTGAAGFIGSHLTEALLSAGANVTALVRYNSRGSNGLLTSLTQKASPQSLSLLRGDITDINSVDTAVKGQDFVFHLAALVAIPYSYEAPKSYLRTNIEGTLNVLESVRKYGTKRLVHTSTSEVYGSALYVPMDETHSLQAQSPYAASKIAADKLVESYCRSFDVPAVTVRPFNTYGPGQSPRAVIPVTIQQALWSDEIRLGAIHPVRDMTFVGDTVRGFLYLGVKEGVESGTFNLGTGEGHSIGDIANRIRELTGRKDTIQYDPDRTRPSASEVDRLVSDHSRITQMCGWKPSVGLDEGLQRTIDWFRLKERPKNPGEYRK
ncbi:SDR family NAD(P)-dependent oxidoreductase [Parahaliea aestuarii]|uniref:SDR family NAD(P)-dependent oxidoreductase n=1 Tax=Parahaliea aestuarii TaxID=1852021 RepID=A0A5C8ZLX0_9GAMM|nr:SDR family NAD(P)-dependent oxidoreductase [Parahaliea aestuarii]